MTVAWGFALSDSPNIDLKSADTSAVDVVVIRIGVVVGIVAIDLIVNFPVSAVAEC